MLLKTRGQLIINKLSTLTRILDHDGADTRMAGIVWKEGTIDLLEKLASRVRGSSSVNPCSFTLFARSPMHGTFAKFYKASEHTEGCGT